MRRLIDFLMDYWIGILFIIFLSVGFGVFIYEELTTTPEEITISAELVDKKIITETKAKYGYKDDEYTFLGYEHETCYYLFCKLDTEEVGKIKVTMTKYFQYSIGDTVPIRKTVYYRKGTNEIKRINYSYKYE